MSKKRIADFIKEKMHLKGITYEMLAEKAGMSKNNLWDKLNKRVSPNFGNIRKILEALGYEIIIEKNADTTEDINAFYETADGEQVSYETVEKLVAAMGCELTLKSYEKS